MSSAQRKARKIDLNKLTKAQILNLRLKDLPLDLDSTFLQTSITKLYKELEKKHILLKPHFWLSNEWFSPDGIPGVAIPFYLAHPKLKALEKQMMYQVEGGSREECLKILRHETGHCVCTAYRLHFKSKWRKVFGSPSKKYPEFYRPKPKSKNFVHHLDWWYAQAHPDEDFAETFAVWLSLPKKKWQKYYQHWPALAKLEYVDELMSEIAHTKPSIQSQRKIDPLATLNTTLFEHYEEKRNLYSQESPDVYTKDLMKIFSKKTPGSRKPKASQFLRKHHKEIRGRIANWTKEHEYTIDVFLKDLIHRCQDLNLVLEFSEDETQWQITLMVTVQTMNFLYKSKHWLAL